ncbi:MAG TPA: EAL domain-containing protein [Solirubrobacteraceae bacterium]|nr:EAL domain-containing protein [Solirubrobacteraceae bacterium]
MLVARVQAFGGADAVKALLREARSRRSPEYLLDIGNWVSYDEAVALWQAGARVTHDPRFARAVGEDAARRLNGSPVASLFRSLGSPGEVYRRLAIGSTKFSTVSTLETVAVGPGFAEIVATPVEGFPRVPEHCAWTCGLLTQPPVLFGLAPAIVEHEQCAALGSPCCRYRVIWGSEQAGDSADSEVGLDGLHQQLEAMRERLGSMFATASDLIGSDEIADVLARITDRAALEVRAPRYLLAVRTTPGGAIHCHHKGFGDQEANRYAERILDEHASALPDSWLVAPVRSNRRDYGSLLAMYDTGLRFFPEERELFEVYARYAASALDSATALTEAKQGEAQLANAQRLAHLGSWEWDLKRDAVERSAEDCRIYGLDADSPPMTYRQALHAVHPDDRDRVEQQIRAALDGAKPFTYEMRILRGDGEVRTLLTHGELQVDAGRVLKVRGTHQDITDRKRMESQLQYQADHDPLTGLYNRRRFAEELERVLRYARRYNRHGALMMLDLDDFKFVNDSQGHSAGDAALRTFAKAIIDRVRESDVVARLGGDEFAIILPETDGPRARTVSEDIRVALGACGIDPPLHISGGIVLFDGDQDLLADDALIAADIALYEAKEGGKDQVRVYHGSASAAVTWVEHIRTALDEGRLVLYGQPMLDLKTGEVAHQELLIRMISNDGELIPPDAFLPTAERFGLIVEIDRWVTREGLRLARRGERISINLSAHSIGDEPILAMVRAAVISGEVDPAGVIFEITESAAMTNMNTAREFVEALIELGCHVALDDFGTGFGSFTYLKYLPTRYLKIDMEFVHDMVSNDTDRHVVDSITQVAHSLGKRTIAEGVEDAATLQALRDQGVDCAQGFFVGRPQRISPLTPFERDLTAATNGSGARGLEIAQ